MKDKLAGSCGVPTQAFGRTFLVAWAAFFVIAAQTTMKAVRDAVFLAHFGLQALAYSMLGMAFLAWLMVSAYHRITGSIGRRRAVFWLQMLAAGSMVLLGEGLARGVPGMPIVLYVYGGTIGLIAIAEIWLLADDLVAVTKHEATRSLTLVGTGAIVGGIFGGVLTRVFAKSWSPRTMLCGVAIEMAAAAVLMGIAARRQHHVNEAVPRPRFDDGLRVLRDNRYVRTLGVVMLCLTVAITTMEWQLKGLARAHFSLLHGNETTEQSLVAFFGLFGAGVSVVSLLLQLGGTQPLLRRFGAFTCMRILPSSLGAVSLALVFLVVSPMGALALACAGAGWSDTLRLSLDKAATELLYVPLAHDTRAAAKRVVDTVVDRLGGAITAGAWLVMVAVWHVDEPGRVGYASVLTLVAVVVWLFALTRMGKEHARLEAAARVVVVPPRVLSV